MVDDHISHHICAVRQLLDVLPASKTFIHAGVVNRIEPGICAIDFVEEGQQMHATKHAFQGPIQQLLKLRDCRSSESVDISDQLNLVFHFFIIHGTYSMVLLHLF